MKKNKILFVFTVISCVFFYLHSKSSEITKENWQQVREQIWSLYQKEALNNKNKSTSSIKITDKFIINGDKKMPYVYLRKGKKPKNGWPLFISLHGGGIDTRVQGPHDSQVNDREWAVQKYFFKNGVYSPDGIYFIPRMTDDRVGRWVSLYNIEIFREVIKDAILSKNVDPNRVYIMGISQGGYGTATMGPLFADYFAAAGSMAGGMEIQVENLLNLPFRSDIGEFDRGYDRIKLARESHKRLDILNKKEKGLYYINELTVQKGRGHSIDYSLTPKWLIKYTRNPYPKKIIWKVSKNDFFKKNFYWIGVVPKKKKRIGFKIEANVQDNNIYITARQNCIKYRRVWSDLHVYDVVVNLSDDIVDLDKKVSIFVNGSKKIGKKFTRKKSTLLETMIERREKYYSFPVQVVLKIEKNRKLYYDKYNR